VLALIWFLNAGNMLAEEIHCQLLKLWQICYMLTECREMVCRILRWKSQ
jgi:hypothetical protein